MSQLSELAGVYDDLATALAVGALADEMGNAAGAEIVANVELFLSQSPPQPNPLGTVVKDLAARAGTLLKAIWERPGAIAAVVVSVGVYEWMTAGEREAIQAINASSQTVLATLQACVSREDEQCLETMAAAAARASDAVSAAASGGIGVGTVLLIGLGIVAFALWGR